MVESRSAHSAIQDELELAPAPGANRIEGAVEDGAGI
jgi:hypothetical protein